ncbi:MAG: hypothetical protein WA708_18880 [Acidobacteriaceae bacterium]
MTTPQHMVNHEARLRSRVDEAVAQSGYKGTHELIYVGDVSGHKWQIIFQDEHGWIQRFDFSAGDEKEDGILHRSDPKFSPFHKFLNDLAGKRDSKSKLIEL